MSAQYVACPLRCGGFSPSLTRTSSDVPIACCSIGRKFGADCILKSTSQSDHIAACGFEQRLDSRMPRWDSLGSVGRLSGHWERRTALQECGPGVAPLPAISVAAIDPSSCHGPDHSPLGDYPGSIRCSFAQVSNRVQTNLQDGHYGFQTASGLGLLTKTSHSRENIEDGIHPDGSSPRLPLPLDPMRLDAALNTGLFHSSATLESSTVRYP